VAGEHSAASCSAWRTRCRSKAGPGTQDTGEGTSASEILNVTFDDSADSTQRNYDVTCGAAVGTLYVHHRLWPVGTAGDPFDFTAGDDRQLVIVRPDPADGHFRFTLAHPVRGQQRFGILVPRAGGVLLTSGDDVFKIVLDPAPPAMSAKMHALVTNATATVSVDVAASVSDWPVRVRIYEGSPNTAPLVDTTISAPTTINSALFSVLAGRALPLRELLQWWTELTNVAGEEQVGRARGGEPRPAADRATSRSRRTAPTRRSAWCSTTDTDSIKVTVPSGKTKTWNSAALIAAGSPVVVHRRRRARRCDDRKRARDRREARDLSRRVYRRRADHGHDRAAVRALVVRIELYGARRHGHTGPDKSYSASCGAAAASSRCRSMAAATARRRASPITVTRTSSPHTYDFKQVSGNTNAPVHVDIPALTLGTGPLPAIDSFYSPSNSPYSFAQHTTTDIIDLVWTSRNTPSGVTFNLDWALDGGAHTLITGVTSPYSHLKTGTGGHGLDLTAGGTASRMRYTLIMKDGSGNEVAVDTLDIEVDHA
jgi:hypothetical protein